MNNSFARSDKYPNDVYKVKVANCCINRFTAFWDAVERGNLRLMRWALQKMDVNRKELVLMFHHSCTTGHMHIARWFLLMGLTPEEMKSHDNLGFQYACTNGHLELAKWLVVVSQQSAEEQKKWTRTRRIHPSCRAWFNEWTGSVHN